MYAFDDAIQHPLVVKALIKEAAGVLKGKTKVISKLNNPAKEGEVERTSDEAMETLLLLASHPQISLWSIKKCGHTHDRGIDTVARECLRWYLMLNLLVAMKEAGSPLGEEMDWDSARPLCTACAAGYSDRPAPSSCAGRRGVWPHGSPYR